jgi:very-short-patch-repair endonuclease
MQCGPVRYRVDAKVQALERPFVHNVLVRPTGFRACREEEQDRRLEFQALYSDLISNAARNALICADVLAAVGEGRSPVVLTERTDHLDLLVDALSSQLGNLIVLQGGMGKKQLKAVMDKLTAVPEDEPRVLLATGRYLGEGFDDSRLDTLFLTLPVSWRGTIAQYAGRLHRLHDGKREVRIYDYADLDIPMLARMFDRRCQGYEAVGYAILLPASAVPGWPPEIPLPIDPDWKRDYTASVQRLIRDGVDAPLGNLFVYAARSPTATAEGVERARSASEAFLFRRLETLEETTGRFCLNKELLIPFNGRGGMEVDFYCEGASLVIELDGSQHLSDADAYRSDRRKDALLQENGYFVLRFLAEDLGKRLNEVLDSILRTLAHRLRTMSK